MQIVAIFLIILLTTVGAEAQTRVAVAGKPLFLHSASSTNPDCSSAGDVVIRITSPASNGRVSIKRGGVFPAFSASDTRSACNRRRVPGATAMYTARRGYTGPDAVTLEFIWPSGVQRQVAYNIMVR